MKRYCVSEVGSNVIYLFYTREQAEEFVQFLCGRGLLWFVQAHDFHAGPSEIHRLLQFEKSPVERLPDFQTCSFGDS